MATFLSRISGAMLLDSDTYETVEAERGLTWQAVAVVVMSSMATSLAVGGFYERSVSSFVLTSLLALVTWIAWAMLTVQIGTRLLPENETRSNLGEMSRTVGFAAAPGLLQVFGVFPHVLIPVLIVTTAWMFAAMVVAVQHALDYRNLMRAVAVCALSAALSVAVAAIVGVFLSRAVS